LSFAAYNKNEVSVAKNGTVLFGLLVLVENYFRLLRDIVNFSFKKSDINFQKFNTYIQRFFLNLVCKFLKRIRLHNKCKLSVLKQVFLEKHNLNFILELRLLKNAIFRLSVLFYNKCESLIYMGNIGLKTVRV